MDCSAVSEMSNHTRQEWLTSQIPPEHKVENEETVFVVLESISQVDDEWMVDLHRVLKLDSGEVSQSPHKRTSSSNLRS